MKHWDNYGTSLFLVSGDEIQSLPYVALKFIKWDSKATLDIDGSDILLKGASVTLESVMPHNIKIFSVSPNAQLHVSHKFCGRKDEYSDEDLILVMENIDYECRAIQNAVVLSAADASKITLIVIFRCNVRLISLAHND